MKPIARKDDLVIQEMGGEILVYDLRTNKAICLNQTSALVWQNCDGKKDAVEIAKNIEKKLGSDVDEDFVWLAVNLLEKENLLDKTGFIDKFNGLSRREVIKKIGLTSMIALPLVSTIIAPMAVHAVSCIPNNATCTLSAQCCSNCCKDVGGGINQCKPGGGACLP